ncbi:hypothetical protein MASR2M54_07970 [Aliarcobacter cryaerophilus]
MKNIDYQGYSTYLELIGIENINTWNSYISENKLDILNSIDGYENLTDEKKLIKFSNEDSSFKEVFDKYHSFEKIQLLMIYEMELEDINIIYNILL